MSPRLDFGGRSDVGMQRQDNQDSLYAGPRLLAVADGVGGAAHGEIASRLTITAVSALDTEQIDDPDTALRRAADDADIAIRDMVARNTALSGMSTTLTAVLASNDRLTLAHIGDSRAYLLRGGQLQQLTHDHTLVQSLIDEGQITEQEAQSHPRRSWILRALDGRGTPEVDVAEIDASPGDRLLVCSDGLSSYVEEPAIARALAGDDPQTAASRLVDLALQAGGSDNISCAVADIADDNLAPRQPIIDGAIAEPEPAALQEATESAVPESQAQISHTAPRRRSIGRRLAVVASLVVVLIAAGVVITTVYVHRQWYVAPEAGKVAVFQGVQGKAAGVQLSHRKVLTNIPITALPQDDRERVVNGIEASGGQAGASQVVANLRNDACTLATATAAPLTQNTSAPKPSTSPSLSGKKHTGQLPKPTHTSPPPTPSWCATP